MRTMALRSSTPAWSAVPVSTFFRSHPADVDEPGQDDEAWPDPIPCDVCGADLVRSCDGIHPGEESASQLA